ncbi:MAG TPA: M10 family metallopeptidase C-terminal domain-containing protein, partial [Pirellulaceae bacterium]|nr:M10 family metallopeptidase C-terminal domain-containing protein [Pirellulaceae bacterium]
LPSVNATFTNIDEMIGSQANGNSTTTGDTLTLNLNTSAVWNIFDRGTGTLNVGGPARDLDFAAFENLTGAPAATDLFTFTMSGRLNGVLNAREGSAGFDGGDTLDYSGYTWPIAVNLGDGWASSISGGIANDSKGSSIENIYGGSSHDLLIGDGDSNLIRGNDGVDNIQAGDGNDLIQVSGKLDAGDLIQAGPGGANDYDIVRNIGSGPVYRTFFNTVFDSFDNSIDEYDGAGQPLLGMENMNFLHLGFTTIRNTPSIDSGDSNDDVTTSYNNVGPSPIVYSGGTGNDHVTLVFTPNQLAALTTPDFATLQAYLASPTGRTLNVTADPSKGNFTASNFETADIAFYEGGVITNVTACV